MNKLTEERKREFGENMKKWRENKKKTGKIDLYCLHDAMFTLIIKYKPPYNNDKKCHHNTLSHL